MRYSCKLDRKTRKTTVTLSRLNHPNIVSSVDVFEENNTVYYIMDYIDGRSLQELTAAGPLPVADALRYIRKIGDALTYIHGHQIDFYNHQAYFYNLHGDLAFQSPLRYEKTGMWDSSRERVPYPADSVVFEFGDYYPHGRNGEDLIPCPINKLPSPYRLMTRSQP